ncbi:hypothetical protein Ancab_017574 [Ancistrocladus abbreviatus]
MVLAERKLGKSPSVECSSDGYMSYSGELFAGAFMEDETFVIKKGEEVDSLAPSTVKLSPVNNIKVGLDCKGKGPTQPNLPWPKTSLDQCGPCACEEPVGYPKEEECLVGCSGGNKPKRGGANSNKSRRVSLNHKGNPRDTISIKLDEGCTGVVLAKYVYREEKAGRPSGGKRKIEIVEIEAKGKKQVTFSKRRVGLFKKAAELCSLSGAEAAVITFSQAGKAFSFGHPSADAVISRYINGGGEGGGMTPLSSSSLEYGANLDNVCVRNYDQQHKKITRMIEEEKAGGSGGGSGGGFWWDETVLDGLELDELEAFVDSLVELRDNAAAKLLSVSDGSSNGVEDDFIVEGMKKMADDEEYVNAVVPPGYFFNGGQF